MEGHQQAQPWVNLWLSMAAAFLGRVLDKFIHVRLVQVVVFTGAWVLPQLTAGYIWPVACQF